MHRAMETPGLTVTGGSVPGVDAGYHLLDTGDKICSRCIRLSVAEGIRKYIV